MTASDLVLGTVQLGASYGIANRTGLPDEEEAQALLAAAMTAGIGALDTARAYGQSEARIGRALQSTPFQGPVITKIGPGDHLADDADSAQIDSFVQGEIEASLSALGQEALDCVLLHRAIHLKKWNGRIWQSLKALKHEGRIKKLGVSVQSPEEVRLALGTDDVAHIQMPANLLDWRWKNAGLDRALTEVEGVTVHVRSAYLQGLLVTGNAALFPVVPRQEAEEIVRAIETARETLGRSSAADLCLAYVRGLPWVDGVVVGMETMDQLRNNLTLFEKPPLAPDEIEALSYRLPLVPEALLNPALWNTEPSPT